VSLSKLQVRDGVVRLRNEAAGGTAALELGLDLEGSMTMTGDDAHAKTAGRITRGRSRIEVEAAIDKRGEATLLDLTLPSSEIHADDLNAALTAGGMPLPFSFSAEDPLRLQASVKGDIAGEALQIAMTLEVSGATFEHPSMSQPMRNISGKLAYDGARLDLEDFHGEIGASDVGGSLSIESFEAPRATFALTSQKADFWELMSFVKSEDAAAAPPAGAGSAAAAGSGDLLAAARATGTLRIDEGSFGSLAFSDLDSTLSLEKKVVRLDPVSMSLYDGRMSGAATMSMAASPPTVSVQAKAATIGVGPLLGDTLDMKDMLSGFLTGELSIAAAGDALDPILASASGSGDIRIENGRVGALNVLGVLSKTSGLLGEKSLKTVSGKLATEGTDFTSIAAGLKVGKGTISTTNLHLISPDLELNDDGSLNMLKGTLEIEGRIIFSEGISQAMVDEGSRAVDVFWDSDSGRVSVPLKLAGPIEAPMPSIDWNSAGGRLARSKIGEALRKRGLGDLFEDGKDPVKREPAARTPDAGALVERSGPGADADADAGGEPGPLEVSILKKEFSGNVLAPDLKIRGTLRGTAKITAATLEVQDRDGRPVSEISLMKQVREFYAAAGPAQSADIKFRAEVDGRKLIKAGRRVSFVITLEDEAGHRVARRWDVER
jgi:AsmA protein